MPLGATAVPALALVLTAIFVPVRKDTDQVQVPVAFGVK
jgi:hypothetical protein